MASRTQKAATTVDDFLAALDHPLLGEIHALRTLVLACDPAIGESIKWNAPSFHTFEHFATMRLHGKRGLQLVLHLGAKKSAMQRDAVQDPAGLLEWLGPDRACVSFQSTGAVAAAARPLQAIIRQWMAHVPLPSGT